MKMSPVMRFSCVLAPRQQSPLTRVATSCNVPSCVVGLYLGPTKKKADTMKMSAVLNLGVD